MSKHKRALITGITGQDGSYLAQLLLEKGYEVHGLVRRSSRDPFSRLIDIKRDIHVHYGDLRDVAAVERAAAAADPGEVYNLAAQSDVGISFQCPEETYEINYAGVGRLVHAALAKNPNARIYQASTSEMFGTTPASQDENSPFNPVSPYARTKLRAYVDYVQGYRARGSFICSGILFNHESPLRGEHFVTRKITLSFAKIRHGQQEFVSLGNLDAKRDWGYAPDYVDAMWRMLQQPAPDDFVIATGVQHTVRQFAVSVAAEFGMKLRWEGSGADECGFDQTGAVRVKVNPLYYRPTDVNALCGNADKAKRCLGWEPRTSFEELVAIMCEADDRAVAHGVAPAS
jgi:GDPmannose 4,6-dehydratase